MSEPTKLVRDEYRFLASTTDHDLQNTTECFTYLLSRRDKLFEKVRFGMLTLNAASLAGLVSVLDKTQGANAVVPLTKFCLGFAAGSFVVGMVLSVIVLGIDMGSANMYAARSFSRMSKLRSLKAMLDSYCTEHHINETIAAMKTVHSDSPRDFDYSLWALILYNGAGGAWIAGILVLFFQLAINVH